MVDKKKEAKAAQKEHMSNIQANAIALHKLDDTLPDPHKNLNATLNALAADYLPWLKDWKAKMGIPETDSNGNPIQTNLIETYNYFLQQTGKVKTKAQKETKNSGGNTPPSGVNSDDVNSLNKKIATNLDGGGGAPTGKLDEKGFWLMSAKEKAKAMDANPAYATLYYERHGMTSPKS